MAPQSCRPLYEQSWDALKANIQFATSYKEKWQDLIPLFEQISAQNTVFIMIYNIVTNCIIYIVDKRRVCGYDSSLYLKEDGMSFSLANIHPKSIHSVIIMSEQGIKLLTTENKEKDKTIVSLEGLYKKNTGEYFHFLQQTICMQFDSEGNPYLFLSYVHDITYLKKAGTSNLVVTTPSEVKCWNYNFDKNCLEPVQPLSNQEKKILSLLGEGKSSKEIANELSLSSHTVDTHRRNLLHKTNCIDTTGMITYARLVGLV